MTAVSEVRILAQPRTVISAAASGGTCESIHISHRGINGIGLASAEVLSTARRRDYSVRLDTAALLRWVPSI